jgi:hypothetical protein
MAAVTPQRRDPSLSGRAAIGRAATSATRAARLSWPSGAQLAPSPDQCAELSTLIPADLARQRARAERLLLTADALREAACAAGDSESILAANGARYRARALLDDLSKNENLPAQLFSGWECGGAGGRPSEALTPMSGPYRTLRGVIPRDNRGGVG